jgi:hypothetical protein
MSLRTPVDGASEIGRVGPLPRGLVQAGRGRLHKPVEIIETSILLRDQTWDVVMEELRRLLMKCAEDADPRSE